MLIRHYRLFYFYHSSNKSENIKNSKISLFTLYSIFYILEADFKIIKMKKLSIFLTILYIFCTLKYVNMITMSNHGNIFFFRFVGKMTRN